MSNDQKHHHEKLHWGRIVATAVLLELTLPAFLLLAAVLVFGRETSVASNVASLIGFLLISFAFGRWVARKTNSRPLLHGALVGVLATALYLGFISMLAMIQGFTPWSGIAYVAAGYGTVQFILMNTFRILGCFAGSCFTARVGNEKNETKPLSEETI